MVSALFPVVDLRVNIPGAPIISADPAFPYAPEPIAGSAGDWIFGPDAASLLPFFGSAKLTPQAATHVWSSNYVTTKASGAALVTDIAEADNQTFWCAFKWRNSTGKNSIVVGNVGSVVANGGFGMTNATDGALRLTTYGAATNQLNLSQAGGIPSGLVDGDWVVVVASLSATAFTRRMTGSSAFTTTLTNARTKHPTNRLSLGNAFLTGNAGYTPVDMSAAMFGIINEKLDEAQVDAVYEEIRARMSYRGLAVGA